MGLNMSELLQPRNFPPTEVAVGRLPGRRPARWAGEANAPREETSECTLEAAGVRVQTHREGSAEITSGRSWLQQGFTATCKDCQSNHNEGWQRGQERRMSPYEQ